ncbi:HAD family hydrolase [Winogradskyella echinorum]|uniref:HAD family hydrolase n=1 Tax=Winogradskyella echinorum TaxID=538189 RepID=A0ABR6Y6H0_9FLAO|nr:HAD family hydrolase [Winogradskyella echinorum]MBC3847848.1 HAD family hydrolase [Winogradskyella echinorum]MBC5752196.1 HAD family hydrolase [Winogradskyella echinorum]
MKEVKMVVTDMDGTLLNSLHEVSSRFFDVYKQLKQRGILFVAASGRPYYSIVEKLHPIKDDIIVIAENGGLIIENKEVLFSNIINVEKLQELYNLVTNIKDTYPIFCTKNRAYIVRASDDLIETISEYYSVYTIIDSFEDIKDHVIKIALYNSTNSETQIFPYVKHLSPELNVVVSGNHWVDISEAITNKGHAITILQKQYNIKHSETMAFGDYNNDLELLKCAKYSYAMANAHPNVKTIANFETKSNNEFGVELILENLISESS